jgi:VanZ family protein
MILLFVLFALLLLAGSFYPWELVPGPGLLEAARRVVTGWRSALLFSSRLDVLVNLIIYIPIGFTAWLWTGWRSRSAATVGALLAGVSLSFTVETLQHYFAYRQPSLIDVACNAASTAAGVVAAAVLARILEARHVDWTRRYSSRVSSALLLLAVWAASLGWPVHAPPFGTKMRLRALLHPGDWTPLDSLWGAVPWLLTARLLAAVTGPRDARWWIWGLLTGAYGIMLLSPGHGYNWSVVFGSVVAVAFFTFQPERQRVQGDCLAWAWLAWIAADGLRPFTFLDAPHAFDWVAFRDLFGGPWMSGVGTLLRKTWMYGSAYWLLAHSRAGAWLACVLLLVVLGAIEAAQLWLPGRAAGLTDLAIAVLAVLLVHFTDRRFSRQA